MGKVKIIDKFRELWHTLEKQDGKMAIRDADRFDEWMEALRKHASMLLNRNECSKNEIDVLAQQAATGMRAEKTADGSDLVPLIRERLKLLCIELDTPDGPRVQWFSDKEDWLAETQAKARQILKEDPGKKANCREAIDAVRDFVSGDSVTINGLTLHVGLVAFESWYGQLPARPSEDRVAAVRELVSEGLHPGENFGETPAMQPG